MTLSPEELKTFNLFRAWHEKQRDQIYRSEFFRVEKKLDREYSLESLIQDPKEIKGEIDWKYELWLM